MLFMLKSRQETGGFFFEFDIGKQLKNIFFFVELSL